MSRQDINCELQDSYFEFFYWFSRFEFALKSNGYLENKSEGSKAAPGWKDFVDFYSEKYQISNEGRQLIEKRPQKQVVGPHENLYWMDIDLRRCKSELCVVICLLRLVRNNLFHGGKHENIDPNRNKEILRIGKTVLDEVADLAGFHSDYI